MAHEGLWVQLLELDAEQTARRANCRYVADRGQYVVVLLESEYVVELSERRIFRRETCSSAGFIEQLCILAYLINARDMPFADKLVRPEALPGGQFFFRGPHTLPTAELAEAFGRHPEDLYRAAESFGARRREFGDASVELTVLPRIRLTIVVWGSDGEFDARASILLDETAAEQLALDALLAVLNLAVEAIVTFGSKKG